jgi:hypothetical protein
MWRDTATVCTAGACGGTCGLRGEREVLDTVSEWGGIIVREGLQTD